jgi:hypothetical protein
MASYKPCSWVSVGLDIGFTRGQLTTSNFRGEGGHRIPPLLCCSTSYELTIPSCCELHGNHCHPNSRKKMHVIYDFLFRLSRLCGFQYIIPSEFVANFYVKIRILIKRKLEISASTRKVSSTPSVYKYKIF